MTRYNKKKSLLHVDIKFNMVVKFKKMNKTEKEPRCYKLPDSEKGKGPKRKKTFVESQMRIQIKNKRKLQEEENRIISEKNRIYREKKNRIIREKNRLIHEEIRILQERIVWFAAFLRPESACLYSKSMSI